MKIIESHMVPAVATKIRLQEYAVGIFKMLPSKSGLKKAIKKEQILLNGKIAQTSDWIEEHQQIDYIQKEEKQLKVFQLKLEVVFEDDYLAVINKPAGYPTSGNYFKTIEHALHFNLKPSSQPDALPNPVPVHRLDNPTSGLLIIAKTKTAQLQLHQDFEEKKIQKTYIALVTGETPLKASIQTKIEDKEASTTYRTLRSFQYKEGIYSVLEVAPKTGRTHQIRRHLSSSGFPIVGDKLYGSGEDPFSKKGLYLAAIGLELRHPIDKTLLKLKVEIPSKFSRAIS
ncbi:tRNA pseudouridine65 synthase [Gillisia sp. Hel_I_86]|uniref:RluA family pseudouridine synthase n=1 Tax=Gillisia sp. Hel_I_86 TaxID=1249981 RepID=UPI00119B0FC2|nr:RluA family pseudouridine synthase [Gillisia sp. Hel_I_86]TVZ25930.1 tRNA pseudouridine65 synthase [Gillisia sp. Hel_I_86]